MRGGGPLKGREAEDAFQAQSLRAGGTAEARLGLSWRAQLRVWRFRLARAFFVAGHAVIPKFCIHFSMTLAILQRFLLLPTPACSHRRGLTSAQGDKCSLPHSPH